MSEKIDWDKHDPVRSHLAWAVVEVLGHSNAGNAIASKIRDERVFDIELKICGHEVEFGTVIDRMVAQLDSLAEKRAKEIVRDKYRAVTDKLDAVMQALEEEE